MVFDRVFYFLSEAQKEANWISDTSVPVGAVLTLRNRIISRACNSSASFLDHAEILCIREAEKKLKTKYLNDCEIFLTLEPCPMCLHAIFLAKIKRVFFSAFAYSEHNPSNIFYKNSMEVYGGFDELRMSGRLKNFFFNIREKKC